MRKQMFYLWGIVGLSVFVGLTWTVTAFAGYESAEYEVVEKDGNIEIRKYPDLTLVSTNSETDSEGKDGSFMRLFSYISGANESAQKIAMTTPVFMERGSADTKATMGFVVPQDVATAGVPKPQGEGVSINKRKGGRFAVIRFSGRMNAELVKSQEFKLRNWMQSRELEGEKTSESAGYDPPFTPGPLRRNEVLIRLKEMTPPESTSSSSVTD
ncbi:SOUL family heme-binding protein [Thalassoglobus polymorphus]|uniref:SOUL heme-binding protein n=1 Tax=Thalassoglobus polymorphus TaxID=2527994 RepID=A0A517QNT4_9PLAN|nr:heme-binding protein [Thalassoglobus polymorphus]QDT33262.1 SOUL heme-binding protein [Thalassoglobus polymorphus]